MTLSCCVVSTCQSACCVAQLTTHGGGHDVMSNRMEKSLATLRMGAFFEHTPKLQICVSEFDITDCLKFCEKMWL